MAITLNPYINFQANTEEALAFYKNIFGGETEISRFSDVPGMPVAEKHMNLIMHSVLKNDHLQLMAADSEPMGNTATAGNISVSLSGDESDKDTLTKYFEGLSEGGTITVPLAVAPWGDTFGMVTDKFGVGWLVDVVPPKA